MILSHHDIVFLIWIIFVLAQTEVDTAAVGRDVLLDPLGEVEAHVALQVSVGCEPFRTNGTDSFQRILFIAAEA